jgi:hypothetical protein
VNFPGLGHWDRFSLNQSGTVQMDCHNDTLHVQGEQVVNDGQTLTAGTSAVPARPPR